MNVTKLEIEIGLYLKEMGGSDYSELCEEFKNEESDDIYESIKRLKEKGYIYSYNDDGVTCYDLQFSDFLEDHTAVKHPFIELLEKVGEKLENGTSGNPFEIKLTDLQNKICNYLIHNSHTAISPLRKGINCDNYDETLKAIIWLEANGFFTLSFNGGQIYYSFNENKKDLIVLKPVYESLSETELRIGKFLYQESLSEPSDIYMELDDVIIDDVNKALDDLLAKELIRAFSKDGILKYDLRKEFINIIEDGEKHQPQLYNNVSIECHKCGHKGEIDLFKKRGGLLGTPSRNHIFGICPKCDTTVISYFI